MGARGKVGVLLLGSADSGVIAVTGVYKGIVGQYKEPGSYTVYQLLKGFRRTAASGSAGEEGIAGKEVFTRQEANAAGRVSRCEHDLQVYCANLNRISVFKDKIPACPTPRLEASSWCMPTSLPVPFLTSRTPAIWSP